MIRTIASIAAAGALLGACASAVADLGFERVDADDDNSIDRTEFAEFMDDLEVFDRYDDDDDGGLDREEYREAVSARIDGDAYFTGFDRDRSDDLSRAEFREGLFESFDADDDQRLSEDEFEELVEALTVEV
ncbi:MAG: EF-hand domain-containing protein [Longimicrobiales bacterium]